VLTFGDEGWFDAVAETGSSLPPPLRVSVDLAEDARYNRKLWIGVGLRSAAYPLGC
jgi:hypothetical protein